MKINFTKKPFLISIVSIFLLLGIGISTAYFLINNKISKVVPNEKSDKDDEINEENKNLDMQKIFPSINAKHYYDLLQFKNNNVEITEEIIVSIIKDIISRITIDFEKVGYKILRNNPDLKEIKFIVIKDKKRYSKTYTFYLKEIKNK